MKREFPYRNIIIASYIAVMVVFFTIHFTRVDNFTSFVGPIEMRGSRSVGTALSAAHIRRIHLETSVFELKLNMWNKAVLITGDGIRHPLKIAGWGKIDNALRIDLSYGAGFIVQSDPDEDSLFLMTDIPASIPPAIALELPFSPVDDVQFKTVKNQANTHLLYSTESLFLAVLPQESIWNPDSQRLTLTVQDNKNPVLEIFRNQHETTLTGATQWLEKGLVPTDEQFLQELNKWKTLARRQWIDSLDSAWDDLPALALLADSVSLGTLSSVLPNLVSAHASAGNSGWLPSPYIGDIVSESTKHAAEIKSLGTRFSKELADGNPQFDMMDALPILIDSGGADIAPALVTAASSIPGNLQNRNILGRISILQDSRKLGINDSQSVNTAIEQLLEEFLLPRILLIEEGLWLVDDRQIINIIQSLNAANLLLDEALYSGDERYRSIGRQMILSAIAYSDDTKLIPDTLVFEEDEDLKGFPFTSAKLYPLVNSSSAYPRHISLYNELGAGAWMLSCAENISVQSTAQETRINVDFPVGSTHHLAIRGIKPFNAFYMNGIQWYQDANFQRYYGGLSYNPETETLYIKIRHESRKELIRIVY